jgi:hypothetical protein
MSIESFVRYLLDSLPIIIDRHHIVAHLKKVL